MVPNLFQLSAPQNRNTRSITQDIITFLNNLIFKYTNALSFETEPHFIYTIPLLREYLDSYLYYIRYKILDIIPAHNPFQIIFNPVLEIYPGIYYRKIHLQSVPIPIQDVFVTYLD